MFSTQEFRDISQDDFSTLVILKELYDQKSLFKRILNHALIYKIIKGLIRLCEKNKFYVNIFKFYLNIQSQNRVRKKKKNFFK